MYVDTQRRIIDFIEKPGQLPGMPDNPDMSLASMGIDNFNRKLPPDVLNADAADARSAHDFGNDIFPKRFKTHKVIAHRCRDSCVRSSRSTETYRRDVGTIDHYWAAHMDMTNNAPGLDVDDQAWPIFRERETLSPPQILYDAQSITPAIVNSIVSPGFVVSDASIRHSLLSNRVGVGMHSIVKDSVLLPSVSIGSNCSLDKTVVEYSCVIPDGFIVGHNAEENATIKPSDVVVLITQNMVEALH